MWYKTCNYFQNIALKHCTLHRGIICARFSLKRGNRFRVSVVFWEICDPGPASCHHRRMADGRRSNCAPGSTRSMMCWSSARRSWWSVSAVSRTASWAAYALSSGATATTWRAPSSWWRPLSTPWRSRRWLSSCRCVLHRQSSPKLSAYCALAPRGR